MAGGQPPAGGGSGHDVGLRQVGQGTRDGGEGRGQGRYEDGRGRGDGRDRAIPQSASWADQSAGPTFSRRRQLSTKRDGLEQVNTFSISLRNVRVNVINPQTQL